MKQQPIDTRKTIVAIVIALSFAFSWSQARAEGTTSATPPAPAPADATTPRPIMVKTMIAGGLRNGTVMSIGAGTMEILRPAQFSQLTAAAQKPGRNSADCSTF